VFLQARSGIDVGSVPRAPTLNCSFLIPQTTCGNGSANRDSQGRFLRKRGTARMAMPQFPLSVYNCC
jgi:hypothetical protein